MAVRWMRVEDAAQLGPFAGYGERSGFEPGDLSRHRTDAHWTLLGADGLPAAHCSLWWREAPRLPGHRVGTIGHFGAEDRASGLRVLERACRELAAHGCTLAVGPMDGNTWRRYRLVTERTPEPRFLMEPDNPDEWPGFFEAAGFRVLSRYLSAAVEDIEEPDSRFRAAARGLEARDVRVRTLEPDRFEEELERIYRVSVEGFPGNFLYTEIGLDEFRDMYAGVRDLLDPRLVFLAEREGQAVGFLFGLPDPLQRDGAGRSRRVILKSMAVVPAARRLGLGSYLMGQARAVAGDLGYRRVIHALMHEASYSRTISEHSARTIRRYALFCRELGGSGGR